MRTREASKAFVPSRLGRSPGFADSVHKSSRNPPDSSSCQGPYAETRRPQVARAGSPEAFDLDVGGFSGCLQIVGFMARRGTSSRRVRLSVSAVTRAALCGRLQSCRRATCHHRRTESPGARGQRAFHGKLLSLCGYVVSF